MDVLVCEEEWIKIQEMFWNFLWPFTSKLYPLCIIQISNIHIFREVYSPQDLFDLLGDYFIGLFFYFSSIQVTIVSKLTVSSKSIFDRLTDLILILMQRQISILYKFVDIYSKYYFKKTPYEEMFLLIKNKNSDKNVIIP